MDEISWSRPRVSLSRSHITCVVCGLRSGAIVCEHCTAQPEASIVWLEKLPSLSPPQQNALVQLKKTQPLTFDGIPLAYWREEVRLNCAVSLARLRAICESRGADFDRTVGGLRKE